MSRRPLVLVSALSGLLTLGCMCGSVGDMIGDQISEKVSEEIAEEIAEGISGAEDIELSDDGASVNIKTDEGEINLNAKEGELPEGFPLAVFKGATINGSMSSNVNGKQGFYVVITTTASPKQVADFYEGELKAKGMGEVTRKEVNAEGKQQYVLAAESGGVASMVMIGQEDEKTNAMITISPKE